ncbi:MAG: hypothetical protein AB1551_08355 [Actinomycetota bacterium]
MEPNGQGKGRIIGSVKANGAQVERSLVGMVRARDVSLARSGAGPMLAGGNVSITQGGCGPMIAGGDVSITQGGCQSVISGGSATLGRSSFVGIVLSPRVSVEDGARVLMSVPQAAALGVAFGIVFGLVRLFRR